MKYNFALRAQNSGQPMIRVVDAYMRRDPTFLAFAEGNPALEACPKEAIAEIAQDLILNHDEDVLLYSNNGGDPEFKELIKQRLARVKGIDPAANEILIMTGGQQGLYLCPRLFVNDGDCVLMEEIAYAGMIDTVHDFRGRTVGVKIDDDGINIEALEQALKTEERVSYIYLVPNFNNPTGVTLPMEKRKAVYELACKYDTLIVEDDPYGDLRYTGESLPSIKSLDTEGRVIYLGTFSKTIAAGLRVGFMCASPEVITKATANKASIDSNTPCINQLICRNYMRDYDFEGNIVKMREIYQKKWAAARFGLEKYLPDDWRVLKSEGGMFCFVFGPEGLDEAKFQEACYANKVGFVPSVAFSASGKPLGGFRMCFTPMTPEQIEEGCRRFGEVAHNFKG
ncbi:MAG: PLP-dependent aminotransferase family protein [Clostridia bacterium]|nr:PLP-dependent aminotransferase family protein [Clostridia bacterium]